jgi:hypothetical protein
VTLAVWFLVLAAMLMPGAAVAQTDIPLTISAYDLPFVTVAINGRQTKALVDTGSFHAIEISGRLADALGIATEDAANSTAQRYRGGPMKFRSAKVAFALGEIRIPAASADVAYGDIENISRQVGTDFDVILGWGFLGQRPLTLDYGKGVLRFAASAAGGLELSYTDTKRVPVISGMLNGQPIALLLDTGAPMSNIDPILTGAQLGDRLVRAIALGADTLQVRFRVKDLTVILRALGCGAVLGNSLWRQGIVSFDPARHRAVFQI